MASVLVVDDDPDIRELVSLNLRLDGHEVLTAADGRQALEVAERDGPDVIVLDVMMPVLDGFGVLEELRAGPGRLSRIPVVMLTARTDRIDRIRGGVEGAVLYLTKPFSVGALRQSVRDVLAAGGVDDLRRRAASEALSDLARLEAGTTEAASAARPRLTRFELQGPRPLSPVAIRVVLDRNQLSARQAQLLDVVAGTSNLSSAARELGVSRSYLYATLGRIATLLGMPSGPEVVRVARLSAQAP